MQIKVNDVFQKAVCSMLIFSLLTSCAAPMRGQMGGEKVTDKKFSEVKEDTLQVSATEEKIKNNTAGQLSVSLLGGILGFFSGAYIGYQIQSGFKDESTYGLPVGFWAGGVVGAILGSIGANYLFLKGAEREAEQRLIEKEKREVIEED